MSPKSEDEKPLTEWVELKTIWLQPECGRKGCGDYNDSAYYGEGRLWCQDPQDPCEECGKEWVKFVLAESDKPI